MKKKVFFITLGITLLLVSTVFSFAIIHEDDNDAVKDFKTRMNREAIKYDLNNGVTPEAIIIKAKYFSGINNG